MAKRYWLLKTEPTSYSIDDLKKDGKTEWSGIRNYQARNYIRDDMQVGDLALIYHSSTEPAGVYGIAEITTTAFGDKTGWDKDDSHYDPKSTPDNPIWYVVEVAYVRHLKEPMALADIRTTAGLEKMMLLQKGSRLSVTPVTAEEYKIITKGR